jgi:hypothetical protein
MGQFSKFRGPLNKPSGGKSKAVEALAPRRAASPPRPQPGKRYEELKATVHAFLQDRFKVAAALKEIHDERLYKDEYSSFDDFCHDEFGISRAYAYRLLEAAKVDAKMSTMETQISNVYAASALAKVPEEKRVNVLTKAADSGRVTARAIRAAAVIDIEPDKPQKHRATCTCGVREG